MDPASPTDEVLPKPVDEKISFNVIREVFKLHAKTHASSLRINERCPELTVHLPGLTKDGAVTAKPKQGFFIYGINFCTLPKRKYGTRLARTDPKELGLCWTCQKDMRIHSSDDSRKARERHADMKYFGNICNWCWDRFNSIKDNSIGICAGCGGMSQVTKIDGKLEGSEDPADYTRSECKYYMLRDLELIATGKKRENGQMIGDKKRKNEEITSSGNDEKLKPPPAKRIKKTTPTMPTAATTSYKKKTKKSSKSSKTTSIISTGVGGNGDCQTTTYRFYEQRCSVDYSQLPLETSDKYHCLQIPPPIGTSVEVYNMPSTISPASLTMASSSASPFPIYREPAGKGPRVYAAHMNQYNGNPGAAHMMYAHPSPSSAVTPYTPRMAVMSLVAQPPPSTRMAPQPQYLPSDPWRCLNGDGTFIEPEPEPELDDADANGYYPNDSPTCDNDEPIDTEDIFGIFNVVPLN